MYIHIQGSAQEISPDKKLLPVTRQDLLPPIPVAPPPIEPGSEEWIYVDEPLPKVHSFMIKSLRYQNISFSQDFMHILPKPFVSLHVGFFNIFQ